MTPRVSSTHEVGGSVLFSQFTPPVPGPVWDSFEQFRKGGSGILGSIPEHGVATLKTRAGVFRILRDSDFQRLVGLASDVHRFQRGLTVVARAARIAVKHPDEEHVRLLMESASLIAESPILPERDGHGVFTLNQEADQQPIADDDEEFDLATATIPRPSL